MTEIDDGFTPVVFEHEVAYHYPAAQTLVCRCGKVCQTRSITASLWYSEISAYGAHLAEVRKGNA